MGNHENVEKAYTAADTLAGTNWAGAAATDSMRDQLGATAANVHLTDAQRKYVIDRVVDESVLLKRIKRIDMARSSVMIPRMGVGSRIARAGAAGGHPEATTAGAHVAPDFENIELRSSMVVVPWEISNEFLEDNPEQGAAEAAIADMMATQLGNDLQDLAVNGDEGSGDALLRANDGFTALGASGQTKDFNAAAFTTAVFEQMLRLLPTKYRGNKTKLAYFVSPNIESDYIQALAARFGDGADGFLMRGAATAPGYNGIELITVPHLPDTGNINGNSNESTIYLTRPENLVWGVQKDVEMASTTEGKNALDLNVRYYVLRVRCDFLIMNTDEFVLGDEITPRVA